MTPPTSPSHSPQHKLGIYIYHWEIVRRREGEGGGVGGRSGGGRRREGGRGGRDGRWEGLVERGMVEVREEGREREGGRGGREGGRKGR